MSLLSQICVLHHVKYLCWKWCIYCTGASPSLKASCQELFGTVSGHPKAAESACASSIALLGYVVADVHSTTCPRH